MFAYIFGKDLYTLYLLYVKPPLPCCLSYLTLNISNKEPLTHICNLRNRNTGNETYREE